MSLLLCVCYWGRSQEPSAPRFDQLPSTDQSYLKGLERDTWRCIASLEAPATGLPFDNLDHGEYTSVSNIGVYLSCVCAAAKMGLLSEEDRDARLQRCLGSVEKLRTQFGFQQSWNSVVDLSPSKSDPWISLLDSGNLAAGLLTVAQAAPKFRSRAEALFGAMKWGKFYDPSQRTLLGGYSMEKQAFNPQWHLDLLASDALMCQFLTVATHGAPSAYLATLKHEPETREGIAYLGPGWTGGGLFMQFLSGIWLDTSATSVYVSAKNFAAAQIQHAKTLGAPVWGWSASDDPSGGYLGWGSLRDEVVTPHACVLAIEMDPREVIANLRALEDLGARSHERGFFDSVNWRTDARSNQFLILDQGMLFLSLANYTHGNLVRKAFGANELVRKGIVSLRGL